MTPAPPKPKEGPGQPRMTEQGGSLRQSGMDGRSPRKRQEQALRWRTVQEPAPGRHKDRRLGRPQKEAAGSSSPNPARAALRGTEDDLDLPAPGKEDPRVSFPAKALLLPTGAQAVAGVRPPPLHHVSFLPEPELEGYILAQEGDTIVLGFRADADSSAGDAPTDSEDLGQDEAEQVESEADPQDDPVGLPADVASRAGEASLSARSRSPRSAADADTEEPAADARVLRRDAQHGRIPGEPPPGRPDTEGHVGLTRIIAHTFGFWAGQAGIPPPRLAVPRPQVAPVPGLPPGFMRVRFLLFPPEYTPELVEAVLPIGSSVDEALHLVAAGRSATRHPHIPNP